MKRIRKGLLVALVLLNLVLLGTLIHVNLPRAEAAAFKTTNYVVITGKLSSSLDGLYVIDLATRKMAAFTWDKTAKRMTGIDRVRELDSDFKVSTP